MATKQQMRNNMLETFLAYRYLELELKKGIKEGKYPADFIFRYGVQHNEYMYMYYERFLSNEAIHKYTKNDYEKLLTNMEKVYNELKAILDIK